jgi:hypothetical protein
VSRALIDRASGQHYRVDGVVFVADLCIVTMTDLTTGESEDLAYPARWAMKNLHADFAGTADLNFDAYCVAA